MKKSLLLIFITLCSVLMISCDEDTKQVLEALGILDSKTMEGEAINKLYSTAKEAYEVLVSPELEMDMNNVAYTAGEYFVGDCLFPEKAYQSYKESIIPVVMDADSDIMEVVVKNCEIGKEYGVNIDGKYVTLSKKDTLDITGDEYTLKYTFDVTGKEKGFISIFEEENGSFLPKAACGLIEYTNGVVENLKINITDVVWIYDIEESLSALKVKIKGNTNGYRIKYETFGEGSVSSNELKIDANGNFSIEIPISFLYEAQEYLKQDLRLALYGTVGAPKIITLKNPM